MSEVTFEVFIDGRWQRAAVLDVARDAAGAQGDCSFEYGFDFAEAWIDSARSDANVSLALPLQFGSTSQGAWPTFLDDVRPMGRSREWWLKLLGLRDARTAEVPLLKQGSVAPVGNVRVAEAVPAKRGTPTRVPAQEVVDRGIGFIDWAAVQRVDLAGAMGAGGDSPKLLLRRSVSGDVWVDVHQDEPGCSDAHVLVKFPRSKSERDEVILRSEYVYYRALQGLGIDTIASDGMELREGPNGPSLWLPRFDVRRENGREVRLGMESMYSLLSAAPGTRLRHQDVLAALKNVVTSSPWPEVLAEYVKRDVLNLVFGNSDNHGRNTSVLKSATAVTLSPVYDFAPMKMDLEGIPRRTTWGEFERGGDVDWQRLLPTFGEHEATVRSAVRELALKLEVLPAQLRQMGLPPETLEFPPIGLDKTAERLVAWGLL